MRKLKVTGVIICLCIAALFSSCGKSQEAELAEITVPQALESGKYILTDTYIYDKTSSETISVGGDSDIYLILDDAGTVQTNLFNEEDSSDDDCTGTYTSDGSNITIKLNINDVETTYAATRTDETTFILASGSFSYYFTLET